MVDTADDNEPTGLSDYDLKKLFHTIWGEAKESPEYDRQKWIDFHVELQRRKLPL